MGGGRGKKEVTKKKKEKKEGKEEARKLNQPNNQTTNQPWCEACAHSTNYFIQIFLLN